MIKPKAKPKFIRLFLYYFSAFSLIKFFKNWYVLPLSYLGLFDLSSGYQLITKKGLRFNIKHFLDAIGVKEVFIDSEYHIPRHSKHKLTIIDIGANIGAFTVFAALNNRNSHLYSFEPSKTTFQLLQKNIKVNGLDKNVTAVQKAVWNKNSIIKLYNPGPSGLRSAFQTRHETSYEKVKTITLAEIFSHYKIKHCHLLKLDCEGAEYEILSSTPKQIFAKIDQLDLEFHELTPDQKHQDLINLLKNQGFKVSSRYHHIENNIGYIYAHK